MRAFFILLGLSGLSLIALGCPPSSSDNPSSPNPPAPTATPTFTPTITTSSTPTSSATNTATSTPSATATDSPTLTPSGTPTNTATVTATHTITNTPTITYTPTNTFTPTITSTPTDTATATVTNTAVYPYQQTIASGGNFSSEGAMAVADSGTGSVTLMVVNGVLNKLDLFTGTATGSFTNTLIPLATPTNPQAVAWNAFNSRFYVTVQDGGNTHIYIQEFNADGSNPGGGGPVTWGFPTNYPDRIAADPNGNVYISDRNTGYIYSFTSAGVSLYPAWGPYNIVKSVAYDPTNNGLAVFQGTGGSPHLIRAGLDGSSPVTLIGTLPSQAAWATFDLSGNLYIGRPQLSGGNEINKYTNAFTLLTSFGHYGTGTGQLYSVSDIAIDHQGYVYASDALINNRIIEYAPY